MSIAWFPAALAASAVTYDGDGKVSFDTDGSVFIERVWRCPYVNAYALCPKPRDSAPAGTPGLNTYCSQSSYERLLPDAAILRATYQGIWNMPFTIYQMDAGRYERPIQYHPQFNNSTTFPDNTKITRTITEGGISVPGVFDKFRDICTTATDAKCKFRGIEAYLVASATWRKTSYTLTGDFLLSQIFKLDPPETGGRAIPDASNTNRSWLKADKTCRNMFRGASQIWEVQESWLYNANGWLSEIYG